MVTYKDTHDFESGALERLFLSVGWSSGNYPEKLAAAMKNYGTVFSAWKCNELIGLVCAMDDGVMTAYVHYMLVSPDYQGQGVGKELMKMIKERYKDYLRIVLVSYDKEKGFYESCGFKASEDSVPMFITSLWT